MCKFYSAIVMKNGDLKYSPFTTSHEDIVDLFNLKDNGKEAFVRVEFSPKNEDDLHLIDKYELELDGTECPEWYNQDLKDKTFGKLKSIVKRFILVKDKRKLLLGGIYILYDCEIEIMKNAIVYNMKSSQVNSMRENSQVNYMRENSQVNYMRENSQVDEMRDNSQVNYMWENSQVNYMWDNSQVNCMRENSQVNEMRDNSSVKQSNDDSKHPKK